LVEKRRTTGTFVAQQIQRQNMAQRRQSLAPHVNNLVIQSRQLGFELADVIDQLRKRDAQLSREAKKS
jgi:DNA-binding transcriptional regulator YhcF (GntR family)